MEDLATKIQGGVACQPKQQDSTIALAAAHLRQGFGGQPAAQVGGALARGDFSLLLSLYGRQIKKDETANCCETSYPFQESQNML